MGKQATKPWLETLTLSKLHKLAVLVGSPCSGTKSTRLEGIRQALKNAPGSTQIPQHHEVSLLSIDMGIRNLAFAHIKAPLKPGNGRSTYPQYGTPVLEAWHRISVSQSPSINDKMVSVDHDPTGRHNSQIKAKTKVAKESFEPVDYAGHAHSLVQLLLHDYKPTQILIERQRFRSGGQSAVQEWTIRVGVFEGMIYAVLRTLLEQGNVDLEVNPMLPPRVNRLWLQGRAPADLKAEKKLSGRETKKAKIDIVGALLESSRDAKTTLQLGASSKAISEEFVSVWKKEKSSGSRSSAGIGKLDDLADCLLQGLAWVEWQNNRMRLNALGEKAFDLGVD
ncbi:hypothetical protein PV10_05421 [Exophiala mesophila]|uniref:Mitochondrial resolvase Ydc2 catalytic domain-containing protein n=1 Tax=Exophiala mesophila TaxID=212818 RepID=A0A0D1Z9X4_EXOME|nr:uncharacterized protein PV10_05421 [Exophiala mesophila]KIV90814.1 hypothetical protein PV10_05421 [Exophiala mesophila]